MISINTALWIMTIIDGVFLLTLFELNYGFGWNLFQKIMGDKFMDSWEAKLVKRRFG